MYNIDKEINYQIENIHEGLTNKYSEHDYQNKNLKLNFNNFKENDKEFNNNLKD